MTFQELPEDLQHILFHSVGYQANNKKMKIGWRNYYSCTLDSDSHRQCIRLAELGFMFVSKRDESVFHVNDDTIMKIARFTKREIDIS